jgi:hypothetical protein
MSTLRLLPRDAACVGIAGRSALFAAAGSRVIRPIVGPVAAVAAAILHGSAVVAWSALAADDPLGEPISFLGTGRSAAATSFNVLALIVPGVLVAGWAAADRFESPRASARERLGTICFGHAGFALVVTGFVPIPSLVHVAFALAASVLAALGITLARDEARRASGPLAVAGAFVATALLVDVAGWLVYELPPIGGLHPFTGLVQRATLIATFGWWAAWAAARPRGRPQDGAFPSDDRRRVAARSASHLRIVASWPESLGS